MVTKLPRSPCAATVSPKITPCHTNPLTRGPPDALWMQSLPIEITNQMKVSATQKLAQEFGASRGILQKGLEGAALQWPGDAPQNPGQDTRAAPRMGKSSPRLTWRGLFWRLQTHHPPRKAESYNDFSLLNYFEIQGVSNSHYHPAPAHSRAQQCLPGTRLFIRRVTWGQPAQGGGPGVTLSSIQHLQCEMGSHLPWLLWSSWERPHGPLVPSSLGSPLPASHPSPRMLRAPHNCPRCKSSRKPPVPGNPGQRDVAPPAPRTRGPGCVGCTLAGEALLKSDPNRGDGAFCILGIPCIPRLSMEAAQAPTLSCKCRRRGQGLRGERCS